MWAPEQPLDERDAFGLRAGQKGRALADGQRLLPELSIGRLRTDRPSNGLPLRGWIPNEGVILRRVVSAKDIRFRPPPLGSWSRRHLGSEVAPRLDCSVRVGSRSPIVIAIVYPSAG